VLFSSAVPTLYLLSYRSGQRGSVISALP